MFIYCSIRSQRVAKGKQDRQRGSGVVEWLGISALSIGLLVTLFTALEAVGLGIIEAIRGQLGV